MVIDDPPPGLRPGLSATAKVTTATRKNAVTVPIQAVTVRMRRELRRSRRDQAKRSGRHGVCQGKGEGKEELQGVFVVRNGRAAFVPVESGIMGSTDMEILKGVQPGDDIVTGSFSVLRTLEKQRQSAD